MASSKFFSFRFWSLTLYSWEGWSHDGVMTWLLTWLAEDATPTLLYFFKLSRLVISWSHQSCTYHTFSGVNFPDLIQSGFTTHQQSTPTSEQILDHVLPSIRKHVSNMKFHNKHSQHFSFVFDIYTNTCCNVI